MTKEEFEKLEWQQISYEEADAGSCTWEHHSWYIKRQIIQPLKNGKPFGKSCKKYFYRGVHITLKKLLEVL